MQFDITKRPEIEAGKYRVETKGWQSARIVCWDRKDDDYPLIVLLTDNEGNEGIFTYSITGEYRAGSPSDNDLILVDEAELTEFEQAVKRTMRQYYSPGQAEDETVRQVASNLRFLARKELEKLPHDE